MNFYIQSCIFLLLMINIFIVYREKQMNTIKGLFFKVIIKIPQVMGELVVFYNLCLLTLRSSIRFGEMFSKVIVFIPLPAVLNLLVYLCIQLLILDQFVIIIEQLSLGFIMFFLIMGFSELLFFHKQKGFCILKREIT